MAKFITITPKNARDLMEKEPEITILDIRPYDEFKKEHIPGAVNLDYDGHQFRVKWKNWITWCFRTILRSSQSAMTSSRQYIQ